MNKFEVAKVDKFMVESNAIEGEVGLNPMDSLIAQITYMEGITKLDNILGSHCTLTQHLKVDWSGKWRTCNVRVGGYYAPDWTQVPELMAQYWDNWEQMDSWEAHNRFETIHPFQDFNGRIGRLIWMSKAINEGYNFNIPFLQAYYYQTLNHVHK